MFENPFYYCHLQIGAELNIEKSARKNSYKIFILK